MLTIELVNEQTIRIKISKHARFKRACLDFIIAEKPVNNQQVLIEGKNKVKMDVLYAGRYTVILDNEDCYVFIKYKNIYHITSVKLRSYNALYDQVVLKQQAYILNDIDVSFKNKHDIKDRLHQFYETYINNQALTGAHVKSALEALFDIAKKAVSQLNEVVNKKVLAYFDYFITFYKNQHKKYIDNWWFYEIGIPKIMHKMLLLYYPYMTINQTINYYNVVHYFVPDYQKIFASHKDRALEMATGANLADNMYNKVFRSILTQDQTEIALFIKTTYKLTEYVKSGDGFYEDGSFIQHINHPYNGAYGRDLLSVISQLLNLYDQLGYGIPVKISKRIKSIIKKGFEPFLFEGRLSDSIRGREIIREKFDGIFAANVVLNAIIRFKRVAQKEDQGYYEKLLQESITESFIPTADNQDVVFDKKKISKMNIAIYESMKVYVYKTSQHMFSIRLSSPNIYTHESINDENGTAWYLGMGHIWYDTNKHRYQFLDYQTINPYYLAGVSNTLKKLKQSNGLAHHNTLSRAAKINNLLYIGFDINGPYDEVRLYKSYLFFEDGYFVLMSHIVAPDKVIHTLFNESNADIEKTTDQHIKLHLFDEVISYKASHEISIKEEVNQQINYKIAYIAHHQDIKMPYQHYVVSKNDIDRIEIPQFNVKNHQHILIYKHYVCINSFKLETYYGRYFSITGIFTLIYFYSDKKIKLHISCQSACRIIFKKGFSVYGQNELSLLEGASKMLVVFYDGAFDNTASTYY